MRHPDLTTAIDVDRPSQARIYDFLLGGSHNYAVDRQAAGHLLEQVPEAPLSAQANRAFLRRAVSFLVHAGVRQFLDIGSGIPTRGNVHEVAQRLAPDSRVVYVDIDPGAIAYAQHMLAGAEHTVAVQEDARRPDRILAHPQVHRLLDLSQPVALLLVSVLHFIPDSDDPAGIVARLRDAVVPGSYLAMSHLTSDHKLAAAQDHPSAGGGASPPADGMPATLRLRTEVERCFAGFELVEPGLVGVRQWRPDVPVEADSDPMRLCLYAGVGRKV
ncbi:MAG TPA: SAM-dependent methyltransferase [Micromonosporaceae bacterium]|nr:SAM-dependent methyltransferase [Micromonosporaceae bacterium]